jgi:serine protease AprX
MQVRDFSGNISNANIERALNWLKVHGPALGVRIVSLSVSGDPVSPLAGNPVDQAVAALAATGVSVVAAAGNDGERRLLPPATAPLALTVGGLDDHNLFSHEELSIWHSNYGVGSNEVPKPELVAPSIWVAAPILPGSKIARQAEGLFRRRRMTADDEDRLLVTDLKLITPHYQHVEGTSFAAPIVASTIACMLEANPTMTPLSIQDVLVETACPVAGAELQRQGAGAVSPGRAVARALAEFHSDAARPAKSPRWLREGIVFSLHDHKANKVELLGSWNNWRAPGLRLDRIEQGFWETNAIRLPAGRYAYKFLIDGEHWLDDPWNPAKAHDSAGGLNSTFVVDEFEP